MNDNLATAAAEFLAHKRALGRKYQTEEATLRLLLAFADQYGVADLRELTPSLIDAFLASRPRARARSFNHLVGILGCFLDWAVTQQRLETSPLPAPGDERRIGACPSSLTWSRPASCSRAPRRFPTTRGLPVAGRPTTGSSPSATGSGYEPGRRAALPSATSTPLDSSWSCGAASSARAGSSPTGRASANLAHQVERRGGCSDDPLFSFDAQHSVHPGSASQMFHRLVCELAFPIPHGVSSPRLHCLRHSFAVGCLLRWYREGLDPQSRLYQLSTFMGHVDPASTAVYLTITPQLLGEANQRFEAFAEPAWSEGKP